MKDEIIRQVLGHWRSTVESSSYNGLKLQELSIDRSSTEFKPSLGALIEERQIDVLGAAAGNSHIKRFEAPTVSTQLEGLDFEEEYHTCIYPTKQLVDAAMDFSFLAAQPYSLELARVVPQLSFRFFSVGVLDRYQTDPRYHYTFEDYAGSISADSSQSSITERDSIYLQSFGLGLNSRLQPLVAAFPMYLSRLSPAHQQYWKSFQFEGEAWPHENYYNPSILGEYFTRNSALNAVRLIIRISNEAAKSAFGKVIFKSEFPEKTSQYLSPFMKPTRASFLLFCMELEKFTIGALNWKFFKGVVETHNTLINVKGKEQNILRGAISILKDWLSDSGVNFKEENAVEAIVRPLRDLRERRQIPAHEEIIDLYDENLYDERRKLLSSIVFSLGSVMLLLTKHPKAGVFEIPNWLKSQEIDYL